MKRYLTDPTTQQQFLANVQTDELLVAGRKDCPSWRFWVWRYYRTPQGHYYAYRPAQRASGEPLTEGFDAMTWQAVQAEINALADYDTLAHYADTARLQALGFLLPRAKEPPCPTT